MVVRGGWGLLAAEGDDGDDELCHAYEKGCESHKRRFLRSVLRHQEVVKREIT